MLSEQMVLKSLFIVERLIAVVANKCFMPEFMFSHELPRRECLIAQIAPEMKQLKFK